MFVATPLFSFVWSFCFLKFLAINAKRSYPVELGFAAKKQFCFNFRKLLQRHIWSAVVQVYFRFLRRFCTKKVNLFNGFRCPFFALSSKQVWNYISMALIR